MYDSIARWRGVLAAVDGYDLDTAPPEMTGSCETAWVEGYCSIADRVDADSEDSDAGEDSHDREADWADSEPSEEDEPDLGSSFTDEERDSIHRARLRESQRYELRTRVRRMGGW